MALFDMFEPLDLHSHSCHLHLTDIFVDTLWQPMLFLVVDFDLIRCESQSESEVY